MLTSHPPHALILDLFMPEMDGFTILERMRGNVRLRDIPVVVVSGGDLTPDQHLQLNDFGQRLISKSSLDEKDLLNLMERALKRMAAQPKA
jgi:CheY-like chemotaxis protein